MNKTFIIEIYPRNDQTLISIIKNDIGFGSFLLDQDDKDKVQSIQDLIDEWNFKQQQAEDGKSTAQTITGVVSRESSKKG